MNRLIETGCLCWQSFMGLFQFSGYMVWPAPTPQETQSQLQLKQVLPATFTSGNHGRDQKLFQGLWDLPGRWKCQGHRGIHGLKSPWLASVCNVILQPPLPQPQGFGCLCSRSALILHSLDLGSVQHLNNLTQSLRGSQSSGPVDYTRYLLPQCVLGPSKQKFTCSCKTTFPEPGNKHRPSQTQQRTGNSTASKDS